MRKLKEPTTDERCGTYAGAVAHTKRAESCCDRCKVAKADYMQTYRDNHPGYVKKNNNANRAREAARLELCRRHPVEYRQILKRIKMEMKL